MDPLIKEFLNCKYDEEQGDEVENAVFRKLGQQAAYDEDLLLDCMEYFDNY
jgi:hypothetical protein